MSLLFESAEKADFQLGLDWFRLLAGSTLGRQHVVSIGVLLDGDRPLAALPLRVGVGRAGTEVGALANFYTSRFAPLLNPEVRATDLASLITGLRSMATRPRSMSFWPLEKDSPEFALLRESILCAGLRPFEYFCFGNWHLPLTGPRPSWDEYLRRRPGEVRNTLRRMTRRFDAEGGRIEIVMDAGDLDRAIAAYGAVYQASWKRPEPHPGFMPGLILLCARRGWLRLGIAWIGAQPIAAQLWIVAHGRASIFKLAYDSEFGRLSPGTLLTAALMRHVIEVDRVDEVDYLTGDDDYKRAWMTHRRERWGIVAYDPRTLGGAWLLARERAVRTAKPLLARWHSRGRAP